MVNRIDIVLSSVGLFLLLTVARAIRDTPANCTYSDAVGRWRLKIGAHEKPCQRDFKPQNIKEVEFLYPDKVIDELGNVGQWTLIYNQGFEFTVAHRKWLVMFDYNFQTKTSVCNAGMPGWTHDTLGRQWKCFLAEKLSTESHTSSERREVNLPKSNSPTPLASQLYQTNHQFIQQINAAQNSWKAIHYPMHEKFTLEEMHRRAGGKHSVLSNRRRTASTEKKSLSPELDRLVKSLPPQFDWRQPPDGRPSPLTPIRDQGHCGSCYAFASTAMLESRIQLKSNFTQTPILSPQDVVDCSPYSQGCDGGFPYLIAGKYAEDFGLTVEECNRYIGEKQHFCSTGKDCTRYYATNYHYLGGYYGACTEDLMKLELVHNGPFTVNFEVYDDFRNYHSGVYHHTKITDHLNKFDPFEIVNHSVLVVGYGVDEKTHESYWAIKNSWSANWGENGYFRIRRGTDECGIESLALSSDPVL